MSNAQRELLERFTLHCTGNVRTIIGSNFPSYNRLRTLIYRMLQEKVGRQHKLAYSSQFSSHPASSVQN